MECSEPCVYKDSESLATTPDDRGVLPRVPGISPGTTEEPKHPFLADPMPPCDATRHLRCPIWRSQFFNKNGYIVLNMFIADRSEAELRHFQAINADVSDAVQSRAIGYIAKEKPLKAAADGCLSFPASPLFHHCGFA